MKYSYIYVSLVLQNRHFKKYPTICCLVQPVYNILTVGSGPNNITWAGPNSHFKHSVRVSPTEFNQLEFKNVETTSYYSICENHTLVCVYVNMNEITYRLGVVLR